jgi:hypothetical protein
VLRLLHLSKLQARGPVPVEGDQEHFPSEQVFKIDTCQRTLWLDADGTPTSPEVRDRFDVLEDEDAYLFLLRVATGLESEIRGETDVFGQIKEAWRVQLERWPEQSVRLVSWMNRLFEDAKAVRTLHLQHTGGGSYGTLTRKLLRSLGSLQAGESVVVLGRGVLAQAVLPHLRSWTAGAGANLVTWNRSEGEEVLHRALATARHAVFCIPGDETHDIARLAAWRAGAGGLVKVAANDTDGEATQAVAAGPRGLLHLGLTSLAAREGAWAGCAEFRALDALFAFQDTGARDLSLERAARACEERARLRLLSTSAGASLSLPHGWEDLLAFS